MSKKATTKRRRKAASDRRIILGALGGYVAHRAPIVREVVHTGQGGLFATVLIYVSGESVARAREESSTGAGGWGTGWRE